MSKAPRRSKPAWKDQPPLMAVVILAGTGPTNKAATYLREVETWVRAARREMPRDEKNVSRGVEDLFTRSEQ